MMKLWIVIGLLCAFVGCSNAPPPPPTVAPTEPPPATAASVAAEPDIVVPDGFQITVAYRGLDLPTALAGDGKQLYVTEFQSGLVKRLTDTNGDGIFDNNTKFAEGFKFPRGIAIEPKTGDVYVASLGQINALRDTNGDGVADENRVVIDNLFYVDASHANNGIAFGPDGKLYITEGHPRQNQVQINPKNKRVRYKGEPVSEWAGTILRADPDGKNIEIFAKGFRNPYDLAFDAQGALYATDNGEDLKQGKPEGDELNLIEQGGDYGFPFFVADPPPDSGTRAPLINFEQASSPNGLVIYESDHFPAEYRGNIFVALFSDPRRIARVFRDANGKWQSVDFITGLNRPIDLVVGADGALYIADMNSGEGRNTADPNNPAVIYRVDVTK